MQTSLIYYFIGFLFTGAFWGITNPFINKYTTMDHSIQEEEKPSQEKRSIISKFFYEIFKLFINIKFLFVYSINQLGSVSFIYLLSAGAPISLAQPICNSLALFFTAIVEHFMPLGDNRNRNTFYDVIGIILIITGTFVCLSSN